MLEVMPSAVQVVTHMIACIVVHRAKRSEIGFQERSDILCW